MNRHFPEWPASDGSRSAAGRIVIVLLALLAICVSPAISLAAPEEIVVFDDEAEKPGEVGYELHLNYANHSRETRDYESEQAPNRVLRFMPEIAWGISPTWNIGLHFPMSHDQNLGTTTLDGIKLRFTNVHLRELAPDSHWFFGANYEISSYHRRLSQAGLIGELRGILGWRNQDWLVSVNPILNRPLRSAAGVEKVSDFDVFFKVMRKVGHEVAIGIEHYAELGPARHPRFGPDSDQITYAIVEFETPGGFGLHLGIGHGWTEPTDRRVYKAMIGLPF